MATKTHNPSANVPRQVDGQPRGDRGQDDSTWALNADEQGISNLPGDEDPDDAFEEDDGDEDDEEGIDEDADATDV